MYILYSLLIYISTYIPITQLPTRRNTVIDAKDVVAPTESSFVAAWGPWGPWGLVALRSGR